jgi:hypothetical protein
MQYKWKEYVNITKSLVLVLSFLVNINVYSIHKGLYIGVTGNQGSLYNDDIPFKAPISGTRAGLLTGNMKAPWDMLYMRYQFSRNWALVWEPRLKFSTYRNIIGYEYEAYMGDVTLTRQLFSIWRMQVVGQFGVWHAQTGAFSTNGARERCLIEGTTVSGKGFIGGVGVDWECLPRTLVGFSYKGLYSLSQMSSTTIIQVNISYRVT